MPRDAHDGSPSAHPAGRVRTLDGPKGDLIRRLGPHSILSPLAPEGYWDDPAVAMEDAGFEGGEDAASPGLASGFSVEFDRGRIREYVRSVATAMDLDPASLPADTIDDVAERVRRDAAVRDRRGESPYLAEYGDFIADALAPGRDAEPDDPWSPDPRQPEPQRPTPTPTGGGGGGGGGPAAGDPPKPEPMPRGPAADVAAERARRARALAENADRLQGPARVRELQRAVNAHKQSVEAARAAHAEAVAAGKAATKAEQRIADADAAYAKWADEHDDIPSDELTEEQLAERQRLSDEQEAAADAWRKALDEKKKKEKKANDAAKAANEAGDVVKRAVDKYKKSQPPPADGGTPSDAQGLTVTPWGIGGPAPNTAYRVAGGDFDLIEPAAASIDDCVKTIRDCAKNIENAIAMGGTGLGGTASMLATMTGAMATAMLSAAGANGGPCPPCPEDDEPDEPDQDDDTEDDDKKRDEKKDKKEGKAGDTEGTPGDKKGTPDDKTGKTPGGGKDGKDGKKGTPPPTPSGGGGGGGSPPPPRTRDHGPKPVTDPTKRSPGQGPQTPLPPPPPPPPGPPRRGGGPPPVTDPTKRGGTRTPEPPPKRPEPDLAGPPPPPSPRRGAAPTGDRAPWAPRLPTRKRDYGEFTYLHKNPPLGMNWKPGPKSLPPEAQELQYLATMQFRSTGTPMARYTRARSLRTDKGLGFWVPDIVKRARTLEQILHDKYGWTLRDTHNTTSSMQSLQHFEPMWDGKVPSVTWLLSRQLHQTYRGRERGPRWGHTTVRGPAPPKTARPPRLTVRRPRGSEAKPSGTTVPFSGTRELPLTERSDVALTAEEKKVVREVMTSMIESLRFPFLSEIDYDKYFGTGIDLTGFKIPETLTRDPSWKPEAEAMILRSMANYPLAWAFGAETVGVATKLAVALAAFTIGVKAVAVVTAGSALVLTAIDVAGVAFMVVVAADGIYTMIREDTLQTIADKDKSIRQRTRAWGQTLDTGIAAWFGLRGLPRMGRQVRSLPGLFRGSGTSVPEVDLPFGPARPGGTHPLPRRMPTTAPEGSRPVTAAERIGRLRPEELDRLVTVERLLGRSRMTPHRMASFVLAHRIPLPQQPGRLTVGDLRPKVEILRRGGWTKPEATVLLRSGLAGRAAGREVFANLAARFGAGQVGFNATTGRFHWTRPDGTLGRRLDQTAARDYSLYTRLAPHFGEATQGRTVFVRNTPLTNDAPTIQRFLDTAAPRARGTRARTMTNPTEPAPEGDPPYRFDQLPPRGRGDATRGIFHGRGWEMQTVLGSSRGRSTDFLPRGFDNIYQEAVGGGHRTIPRAARIALTHAELQAVGLMRSYGIKEAWIEINHRGGPCQFCQTIARVLPRGATLHVRYVDATTGRAKTQTFEGEWEGVARD